MGSNTTTMGMYIRFDPNKIVLPPIFGGPAPLDQCGTPLACGGPSPSGTKRKRDTSCTPGVRFNNFEKVLQRATQSEQHYAAKPEHDGVVTKDRLKAYDSRDQLMQALRDCFRKSHDINFAASYRTHDPGVSHKQRIQNVNHEIWKATGYRFTVKDHPRTKDGHKTRLWCSQDESHKNKPSKTSHTPRTSSDGAALAKARYPCRSGLLISSRDDDDEPGTVIVVVRMHHHFAHEAYYDHTLPPEMTQSIWEKMAIFSKDGPSIFPPPPLLRPPRPQEAPAESDNSDDSFEENSVEEDEAFPGATQVPNYAMQDLDPALLPPPQSDAPPALEWETYQARMRRHITNIREFCDGLEYQLPFNDFRLLEVLESEGAQFLKLVHHCLELEGRLKAVQAAGSDKSTTIQPPQAAIVKEDPPMASLR